MTLTCELDQRSWPGQVDDATGLFCGADWTLAGWQLLPRLGAPYPLRLADEDGVTVLPMSSVDDDGRRRVVFAGGPMVDVADALSSATDPVAHTRRLLFAAREALRPGDWLDLRPIRPDGLLARAVGTSAGLPGFRAAISPAGTSPSIRRPADGASITGKFARKLRRAATTLSAVGELSWTRRTAPSGDELTAFLDRRQDQWRRRGTGGLPWPQEEPGFAAFLAAGADGAIVLDQLAAGGRLVAQDLYLQAGGHRMQYLRYFDPELARHSPGHVLLSQSCRPDRLDGVDVLDFGRGDERWKYDFGAADRALIWVALTAV